VSATLDLSVIVPAHNEGPNLRVLLPQLRAVLDGLGIEAEVMVVVRHPGRRGRRAGHGRAAARVRLRRRPAYRVRAGQGAVRPHHGRGSALGLPFRDGAVECVSSSQLLEALPRGAPVLAEMWRVPAPAGRLILATPDYGRWQWILLGALYQRLVPGAGASRHLARYTKRELVADIAGRGGSLEATRSILAFRKGQSAPSAPSPSLADPAGVC
jgi:hypothetical protein